MPDRNSDRSTCPPTPTSKQAGAAARQAMNLSVAVGVLLLGVKVVAWLWTGSAALLGDAAESVVHVAAVCFATYSLRLQSRPADANHPYGHWKIAFFSAGAEGVLILLAAIYIISESLLRWTSATPTANLVGGLALTSVSVVLNLVLSLHLLRLGKKSNSIILIANGQHVLTDVWTSVGALAGLSLVYFTGWQGWDPICAILLAANILRTGLSLMKQSVGGLMDTANPALNAHLEALLLEETTSHGVGFHALRHRDAGGVHFVDVHLLFPDEMPLREAHRLATEIERELRRKAGTPLHLTTHLEPQHDHDAAHAEDEYEIIGNSRI